MHTLSINRIQYFLNYKIIFAINIKNLENNFHNDKLFCIEVHNKV